MEHTTVRRTDPHISSNSLHDYTLPQLKIFNITQVQPSEIAIPSSPARLPLAPSVSRLALLVRIRSGFRRRPVRWWFVVGLRSCIDRVGFRRVVFLVRVAGRGLVGPGFLVEAVAEGDAHYRKRMEVWGLI